MKRLNLAGYNFENCLAAPKSQPDFIFKNAVSPTIEELGAESKAVFHLVTTEDHFSLVCTSEGQLHEESLLFQAAHQLVNHERMIGQSRSLKRYVEIFLEQSDGSLFTLSDAPTLLKEGWEIREAISRSLRKLASYLETGLIHELRSCKMFARFWVIEEKRDGSDRKIEEYLFIEQLATRDLIHSDVMMLMRGKTRSIKSTMLKSFNQENDTFKYRQMIVMREDQDEHTGMQVLEAMNKLHDYYAFHFGNTKRVIDFNLSLQSSSKREASSFMVQEQIEQIQADLDGVQLNQRLASCESANEKLKIVNKAQTFLKEDLLVKVDNVANTLDKDSYHLFALKRVLRNIESALDDMKEQERIISTYVK